MSSNCGYQRWAIRTHLAGLVPGIASGIRPHYESAPIVDKTAAVQAYSWTHFTPLPLFISAGGGVPNYEWQVPPSMVGRPNDLGTWTFYDLPLISSPKLPPGVQRTDRPPGAPPQVPSWAAFYNRNLIGKDRLPTGVQRTDRWREPPFYREWSWNYNLNLVGKDRLPAGVINDGEYTDRPQPPPWYRDWVLNLQQTTLAPVVAAVLPPGVRLLDLPRGSPPPVPTWTFWYNLNLVGKDRLPAGKIYTDRFRDPPWYREWYWKYNQNLIGKDKLPVGEIIYDRVPLGPRSPNENWFLNYTYNYTLTLPQPTPTPTPEAPGQSRPGGGNLRGRWHPGIWQPVKLPPPRRKLLEHEAAELREIERQKRRAKEERNRELRLARERAAAEAARLKAIEEAEIARRLLEAEQMAQAIRNRQIQLAQAQSLKTQAQIQEEQEDEERAIALLLGK